MVFYVQRGPHGSDRLYVETIIEACRNRELSVPLPQAYLDELACDERDRSAGADGNRWLEVV